MNKKTVTGIETRLVYGFLDAGKTTYIQDCMENDRFYKYGHSLILCFEKGVSAYDEEALAEKNTSIEYYGGGDIKAFCEESIEAHRPDRIYVEMNTMMQGLREQLPECMRIAFVITLIDWSTMAVYYANLMQMMKQMVSESHQVTFRGCPSCELLEPYAQAFRLMNPRASYLRQDPMGYHEKAFGLFLPFSREADEIAISEKYYLPFWLDALDHPEHYDGKLLRFTDPLEIRRNDASGSWSCGRVVMTCCMADLQFMSVELEGDAGDHEGWACIDAAAVTVTDSYGRKKLRLKPKDIHRAPAPPELILDGRVT